MDYKEQIDRLRSEVSELENSELAVELFDDLITDLLARAEAAEARVRELETSFRTEKCENGPECAELGRARRRAEAAEARAEKAERERDGFKAKYIEAVNRACELSKIVDDHGWEE